MKHLVLAFVVLASFSFASADAAAQEEAFRPDAYLQGQVLDQHGDPVPDAQVSAHGYGHAGFEPKPEPEPAPGSGPMPDDGAQNSSQGGADAPAPVQKTTRPADPGFHNETRTDDEGRYRLGVRAGSMSVRIHREGYAGHWQEAEVAAGANGTVDVELLRFPDKTARIEGRVTGPDARYVSMYIESPVYGISECTRGPDFIVHDTVERAARAPSADDASGAAGTAGTAGATGATGASDAAATSESAVAEEDAIVARQDRCAIEIADDGTFLVDVTPGYSIIRVHFNDWRACDREGNDACQRYLPFVQTLDLPADETTRMDIVLEPRPAPDAQAEGYLVDEATQQALPDGHVSFSRLDGGGHGWATTDQDGSYRIRLDAGIYEVSVYAPGHLPWAGIVHVADTTRFDVTMTAGASTHCCYEIMPLAADGAAAGAAAGTSSGAETARVGEEAPFAANDAAASEGAGAAPSGSDYEDLDGGLGPYEASGTTGPGEGVRDAPAAPVLLVGGILGLLALARGRDRR